MSTQQRRRERLYLLDGMALAYRAYFSFISRPLINSKGENTSAIFGFTNVLMKILNDEQPDHIAVVFDTKEPTFRHIMYEPYKATREKMPEDLSGQLDKLKEVVQAFNVPCLELPGYEADDIMGTLARTAEKEEIETYLVTGDKDFMQLISPFIKMFRPGKGGDEWEILDEAAVKAKFGVSPDRVIDVLGLIGDKSDNVPGVPGIGEKTAIPLVLEYGSIESILKNVDKIPQKGVQAKLREHADLARLSRKLVTIDTNVPLSVDLHHLNAKALNIDKLKTLFSDLEFRGLLKKISQTTVDATPAAKSEPDRSTLTTIETDEHEYHLVTTEKELRSLASKLKKSPSIVFDTETTSTDELTTELVGISFAISAREAWYVPIAADLTRADEQRSGTAHDLFSHSGLPSRDGTRTKEGRQGKDGTFDQNAEHKESEIGLPLALIISALSPIFETDRIKKIGQNIKFDILVLASHGVNVRGVAFDTMVASYLLRPDGAHNMDDMAAEHLNYKTITYDELTGTGNSRKELRDIEIDRVAAYAAEDADVTLRLHDTLKEKLTQNNLDELASSLEFPLIEVLANMELTGIALDTRYLSSLSKDLDQTLIRLTSAIYKHSDESFNINSTQQLSKILFDKLRLPPVRKTKTGYSTDVSVLEELRPQHPIIEQLLEYRQVQKLKSTYVDALPLLINERTGRLHTSYNQAVAATGRLSSSNPNLQNIPIRTELGSSIRRAFIPGGPKLEIMSADYSQIELRIMAHISGDEGLTEAFRAGEDIHATTAAKVFGVRLTEVTKDMRRKAKEVNFGIMYGIGAFGLARRLDIGQGEAKDIIEKYFARFPKVNQYIFDTIASVKRDGFVTTLRGRRRYLPDINSKNGTVRANAERQAINMPIQGTAADMIKLAMLRIFRRMRQEKLQSRMLLQVHDELVFDILKKENVVMKALVLEEMKEALPLNVPVEVDIGVGQNWLEAH